MFETFFSQFIPLILEIVAKNNIEFNEGLPRGILQHLGSFYDKQNAEVCLLFYIKH